MKKIFLTIAAALFFINVIAQVNVKNLRVENRTNPVGLDIQQPRFSWQLVSDGRNVKQTAYEIKVGSDASIKSSNTVWSTGKVNSDASVHIPYAGNDLQPDKTYFWQVRVWDNNGKASAWSEPSFWHTAFFQQSDWKAKWIEPGYTEDSIMQPSPMFRKTFAVNKKIKSATAFVTAHGVYEAFINGKRIGDAYLTPGWTSYQKRLQYQTYNITDILNYGNNAVGAMLGNGWYRGFIGFAGKNNNYGKDIALLMQINITYTDGTQQTIITDESWKSTTGTIKSSEIYDGETYDARDEKQGWTNSNYDDVNWSSVRVASFDNSNLLATYNEPIRKHETFKPVNILKTPKGEQVIDFGQNLVGWVIVKANGKAGDSIKIYHAEVLDKQGNFYTENLRSAKAEDLYILKGGSEETFEPHFTFHGFRYIKIEGYPGELTPDNFTAVALYSDMKPTGTFSTSNALINQLQHNIQWGQKGNFLDVPTDCPQRDERLGWTGDAQVFSRTATFNMNVNDFYTKWLKDVAADQLQNGSVPFVVPNVLGDGASGSAGWADVATILPWNLYLAYADKRTLEEQYPSMKAWVEYMHSKSKNNLWNIGFHFGDWLFYRPFDDNDGRSAVTDKYLIAQCFYAHSTQLLINAAQVLGKQDDVNAYASLLKDIKDAFIKEYVTPNGRLVSGTQTAYVLALNFDMLPDAMREEAAQRLVENVKSYGNHLTTGFLGTPYLCHVLTRFGHTDVAYKLLMQETYPSWLYPVKMGATTIWERWDGIKPDSTFQTPGMNSFNHYAYGAIGDWMYRVITGIDTYDSAPGYKQIKIMPHIGGGLTYANADYQTNYGLVSSHWKTENGQLQLEVEIPANTTARIFISAKSVDTVTENNQPITSSKDFKVAGKQGDYIEVEIGSGKYNFVVKQ